MAHRSLLAGSLGMLVVALAGCGTTPHPAGHTGGGEAASGHGIYKIGQPYEIDGTWYYPAEQWDYDESGIASWYGEAFHGKYTANGEVFDLNGLTAAHRTLPLPSIVRVTNLDNGRTLDVRINDRGPFASFWASSRRERPRSGSRYSCRRAFKRRASPAATVATSRRRVSRSSRRRRPRSAHSPCRPNRASESPPRRPRHPPR
jgi:hypothetical protein